MRAKESKGEKMQGLRKDDKFTNALTEEEIKETIAAYDTYNGNESLAEVNLPYTRKTIRKYWKINDLKPTQGRRKEFDRTILLTKKWLQEQIIEYQKKIKIAEEEIHIKEEEINYYKIVITDCLDAGIGIIEIAEDICINKEKARFMIDYIE